MRRLALLLLLVAACARSAERKGFVLRVAVVGPLAPLHPLLGTTFTAAAHDLVFQAMLIPDERGMLTSQVLRRWERVDSQRYRIQPRPDLRFSDGSPVLAEDLLASLASRRLHGTISGEWIEVGSSTVGFPVEPVLIYTPVFKETASGFLGTGPYRLVEQTETHIALERVKPIRGRIDRVELRAFPTPRDLSVSVLRSEANAVLALDERQLVLFEGLPALRPVQSLSPHAVTVIFNTARLDGVTRRQLRAALPVDAIAAAFDHRTEPGTKNGKHEQWELPRGRPLGVLTPRFSAALDRAALAVRRALGHRGGEVASTDALTYEAREKAGDFDIAVRPTLAWPETIIALTWHSTGLSNWSHYSNPKVDAAFARGDFATARAELEADAAFVEVCRRERFGVVDSRIKNPRLGWFGILDTLPDWEVEEGPPQAWPMRVATSARPQRGGDGAVGGAR